MIPELKRQVPFLRAIKTLSSDNASARRKWGRIHRLVAGGALVLTTINCSASSENQVVQLEETELTFERRIDGDSPFWPTAPYFVEGPFSCPIPQEVLEVGLAQAHETLTIQYFGTGGAMEIMLEGSSADSSLSAEPLLIVYAGEHVPDGQTAVANCLGISKPGGGTTGSVTLAAAPGDFVTAIALEPEIGPGFDGSGSGTFRWLFRPLQQGGESGAQRRR